MEIDIGESGSFSPNSSTGEESNVVKGLMDVIDTVGSYVGFRRTQRKECLSLVRRLKLLVSFLEEIREANSPLSPKGLSCLLNLKNSLLSAKKLLKYCNFGSKIYLALESEAIMCRFHAVYDKLYQALDALPYDELGISEEVKEQVELMRMQLRREKRRTDSQDIELAMDMMVVCSTNDDRNADSAIVERLAKKLELRSMADLRVETAAIRRLINHKGGHTTKIFQQILDLLGKFKEIAGIDEKDVLDGPVLSKSLEKYPFLHIPHEFLCPITLEIMRDPVIIATGQTYERESIQKWLDSNHWTCPKSGQTLTHLSLAPNYALRNLILQWCEKNNYELPNKDSYTISHRSSVELQEELYYLVQDLSSSQLEEQKKAVMAIRMLSKENPDNRILIAGSGGIAPLVKLLSCPDLKVRVHAVTALLNLSIDEANKRLIAQEGAIPSIIQILQNGTDEAKENAAAALFSLSMLDENKAIVGSFDGILPLVNLLRNGTIRGKKDAATALFNLCLNKSNKSRAIKAAIIPALIKLVEDRNLGMVDEALSILQLLASYHEGRNEIGQLSFIKTLVDVTWDGTPKNKECATSLLLELGLKNSSFTLAALQYGVYDHLINIARCGTTRAQRKANSLLQLMSKCEHIP
ncbi:Armadillo [Dillenia turbinata]|uniref:RING-type E3 ubiquitin transferase n=1 Tax=Dillenia turbinata TaxID=194707 RepID=A0AAN8WI72_9MAGN